MTDVMLPLFDLDEPTPSTRRCAGWATGRGCRHPDHIDGTYQSDDSPIWTAVPCHECGEPLPRFRRLGHHELSATTWEHLRGHAHTRTPIAMDGRLWIGHPKQVTQ